MAADQIFWLHLLREYRNFWGDTTQRRIKKINHTETKNPSDYSIIHDYLSKQSILMFLEKFCIFKADYQHYRL